MRYNTSKPPGSESSRAGAVSRRPSTRFYAKQQAAAALLDSASPAASASVSPEVSAAVATKKRPRSASPSEFSEKAGCMKSPRPCSIADPSEANTARYRQHEAAGSVLEEADIKTSSATRKNIKRRSVLTSPSPDNTTTTKPSEPVSAHVLPANMTSSPSSSSPNDTAAANAPAVVAASASIEPPATKASATATSNTKTDPAVIELSDDDAAERSNRSDLEMGEDEDDFDDFDEDAFDDYSDYELEDEQDNNDASNDPQNNQHTQPSIATSQYSTHSSQLYESQDFDDDDDADVDEEDPYAYDFDDTNTPSRHAKDAKVYGVSYSVLTAADVTKTQLKEMNHVSSILSVTPEQSETLLWLTKWNPDHLVERYIDNPAKILKTAGVGVDPENASTPLSIAPYLPDHNVDADFVCFICYDTGPSSPSNPIASFGLECGHRTCLDCYKHYARSKIVDEGMAESLSCPQHKCDIVLNKAAVASLFEKDEPEVYKKYLEFRLKHFVQIMEKLTFCPAANCEYIVECPGIKQVDPSRQVPAVRCTCGNSFCFKCQGQDHSPATCQLAALWLKRCRDDSETANWIKANTQECPKCHSTIEKNGGCNHMTCKQCRYEFCWMCMGSWQAHGNQFYNCSRYNESDAKEAREGQAKSRNELNRYLHYYNRFRNHQQSLALDSETFDNIQRKMKEMQESAGMSWIEVQYLTQAFEVLRRSRQTLTWTYAFAFYLNKSHQSEIFEDNQANLELATEELSELFEKPASELVNSKVKLLDKSHYVDSRREVMLEHAAKGLMNGTWEYQEDLLRGVMNYGPPK